MNRDELIDDIEESVRIALDANQAALWTSLPGIVQEVDLVAQAVSVQPAIRPKIVNKSGEYEDGSFPLLINVPIVWPRTQNFALTLPVAIGDEVLVVFASRCIDAWWESGVESAQAEVRFHDLSDGFAVFAPTSQPKRFNNVSANSVQLRDKDGTTYLEVAPGGVARVIADSAVEIVAPSVTVNSNTATVTTSTAEIDASVSVYVESPNIQLDGSVLVSGSLTVDGALVAGGIDFSSHVHSGVTPGGSNTGVPVS